MDIFAANAGGDPLGRQVAAFAGDRPDLDAGQDRQGAGLVVIKVRLGLDDNLLASRGVGHDRDLVAHGAAGDEERRFLADHGRARLLKLADGGILAKDIVAHLGPGHGLAHGRRGFGHGIAA